MTSAAYAKALTVTENLGEDTSTTRTPAQTATGMFWSASPIWNVWNEVAQAQATARDASLEGASAMFATLDLALADTAIGLYDAKYHYQVWRPITAIRAGASTGNPGIIPNPNWNSLTTTAPDPSYPKDAPAPATITHVDGVPGPAGGPGLRAHLAQEGTLTCQPTLWQAWGIKP